MNQEHDFPELAGLNKLFPNLKPIKKLGEGGMCSVFQVLDKTHDKVKAIKVMHESIVLRAAEHQREQEMIQRFHLECRLGVELPQKEVPGIPEVYVDFNLENPAQLEPVKKPAMIKQYVPGNTVKSLMPITSSKAIVAILYQLTESLMHLHRVGVVHGDLTPDNVMLDPEGKVWILDFGIARTIGLEWSKVVQEEKPVLGKKGYLTPESQQGKLMTPESDVFIMALVVVFLFTDIKPTPDSTLNDNVKFKKIPETVRAICVEGLKSNPEERPASKQFFEVFQTLWNQKSKGEMAQQYLKSWLSAMSGTGTLLFPEADVEMPNSGLADQIPKDYSESDPVENDQKDNKRNFVSNYFLRSGKIYIALLTVVVISTAMLVFLSKDSKDAEVNHLVSDRTIDEDRETIYHNQSLSELVLSAVEDENFAEATRLIDAEGLKNDEYLAGLVQAAAAHKVLGER